MLAHLTAGESVSQPYNAQTKPFAVIDEYDSNGKLPTDLFRDTSKIVGSGANEHRTLVAGAILLQISNHFGGSDFVVVETDFSATIDFGAEARAMAGFAEAAKYAAVMAMIRNEPIFLVKIEEGQR
mmetsp:Transcript_21405/g.46486  ORF Transcript_21405/g.46486 Transcript_21405/m.46486 type:complete len:126 (-) Transcript_21405:95-472(-)